MKAVLLDVPDALLDERRAKGLDKMDEMWDGVVHMVPPAGSAHGGVGTDLLLVLGPVARTLGLRPFADGTGVFRTAKDYRVPDQQFVRPELVTPRGVEGAVEFLVEIRSPRDETYEKLDWYAARGVREVLIVEPLTRAVELYVTRGGRLLPLSPDADGALTSSVLGLRFATVDGPLLRITGEGVDASI